MPSVSLIYDCKEGKTYEGELISSDRKRSMWMPDYIDIRDGQITLYFLADADFIVLRAEQGRYFGKLAEFAKSADMEGNPILKIVRFRE